MMNTKKLIRRLGKRGIILIPMIYFFYPIVIIYLVTGFYDVIRQKNINKTFLFKQYFLGNGTLTWIFSPLNMLIDIFSLPFINRQVYNINQLPEKFQKEINTLLNETPKQEIRNILSELNSSSKRTMLFYKWYSYNIKNNYTVPLFHRKFKYIKTIGISNFNPQTSTSKHFGWLRAGIRVLINIDENTKEGAYIDVNNQRHVWKTDGNLFIFDDTVLHQSFNLTDQRRSCLFVDILRPSPLLFIPNTIFRSMGFISTKFKGFQNLSNWEVIK